MQLTAKALRYGDHVDTDVIIPARYLNNTDLKELAQHCMEDIDPDFHKKLVPGDIVVAGVNFGCGSSREHAPLVLRESGVSLVIAQSFARIFYRNAINIGLPILECAQAARSIEEGDRLRVDLSSGVIENKTKNETYQAQPFAPFVQDIIRAGGLQQAVKKGLF